MKLTAQSLNAWMFNEANVEGSVQMKSVAMAVVLLAISHSAQAQSSAVSDCKENIVRGTKTCVVTLTYSEGSHQILISSPFKGYHMLTTDRRSTRRVDIKIDEHEAMTFRCDHSGSCGPDQMNGQMQEFERELLAGKLLAVSTDTGQNFRILLGDFAAKTRAAEPFRPHG